MNDNEKKREIPDNRYLTLLCLFHQVIVEINAVIASTLMGTSALTA